MYENKLSQSAHHSLTGAGVGPGLLFLLHSWISTKDEKLTPMAVTCSTSRRQGSLKQQESLTPHSSLRAAEPGLLAALFAVLPADALQHKPLTI